MFIVFGSSLFQHRNVQTLRNIDDSDDLAILKVFDCCSCISLQLVFEFFWWKGATDKRNKITLWTCETSPVEFLELFCDCQRKIRQREKSQKWIMYKLLGGLKDYFKLQEIQTDNAVFRLHNVFTTVLLLTCSLVITATQYGKISHVVNITVACRSFLSTEMNFIDLC
jgi:hypothetical protein